MTQTARRVPTPGEALGGLTIFDAKRPIEWDDTLIQHYDKLTSSLGTVAAELGVAITIPEERPSSLTIVGSPVLRAARRKTSNGDFSRQVIPELQKAGADAPLTMAAHTEVIGLPTFSNVEDTVDHGTFSLRVVGEAITAEQQHLLAAAAEVAQTDIEPSGLKIDVATIAIPDWQEHSRAFIDGIDRSILHRPINLGRLVVPTHVGAA